MSDKNPPMGEEPQAKPTRRSFMRTASALAAGVVIGGVVGGVSGYYFGQNAVKSQQGGLKQGTGSFTIGTSVSTAGPTAPAASKQVDMFNALVTMVNAQGGIYARGMGGYIPLKMIVLTDGGPGDLSTIKANYTTLATQNNVDLLIGPFTAAPSETASPVAIQNSIPYIDNQADEIPIFAQPDPGNWVVGSLNLINYWLWNYFNVLKNQTDAKTIAMINLGDDFSTEVTGSGASKFGGSNFAQQLGFNVLATDSINTSFSTTFDYTAEVQRMKSLDPDVIVFTEPSGIFQAAFWQACQTAGYKPRAFHPTMGALKAFQATVGSSLGNGVTGEVYWDGSLPFEGLWGKTFWQNLQTTAGFTDFDWPWLSIGYSCVEIAAYAVEFAGSTDKPSVASALNTMAISNLLGPWKAQNPLKLPFAPPSSVNPGHGMSLSIGIPVQIINGKRVVIGPPDIATGTYVYPQPTSF